MICFPLINPLRGSVFYPPSAVGEDLCMDAVLEIRGRIGNCPIDVSSRLFFERFTLVSRFSRFAR